MRKWKGIESYQDARLINAIKLKKANDLRDIDANKLTLYKVLIADAVFRHTALSLLLLVA